MNLLNIIYLGCFFIYYSVCYEFDPPSKLIEIVEGGFYIFGLDEFGDTNIVNCTFISDTGHTESFDVGIQVYVKKNNTRAPVAEHVKSKNITANPRLFTNKVSNFGADGLCKIKVDNVNDKGPKIWSLSAYEEYEETYIRANFTIKLFYKTKLVAYEIRISEGASFFNHLILPEKLTKCTLTYNSSIIDLDLNSPRSTIVFPKESRVVETRRRIFPLGRQLCGFHLVNVSKEIEDTQRWTLTAINDKRKPYRASFVLRINAKTWVGPRHVKMAVELGQAFEMNCGSKIASFCSLLDPRDVKVYTKDCTHNIWSVTTKHLGIWKCSTGSDTDLVGLDSTTELVIKEQERVETWMNQTADYVHIGCQIVNPTGGLLQYCKLEAPNHKLFKLKEYSASDRHLSIGTNFSSRVCSMQIQKPLQASEKGLWTCEMSRVQRERTGGYIHVGDEPIPSYPKLLDFSTRLNEPLTITCQVPYFSEYCSIKSPNGTIYNMIDVSELRLGNCIFPIKNIGISDNGTWTCYFARQTGLPDEEIRVDVTVAEVLQYYKSVEADVGTDVKLECSTGGPAIRYCRFVSPQGVGYQIQNKKVSERISYFGEGFEHGVCGITIKNIYESEKGIWKCVTKLYSTKSEVEESEVYGEIRVEVIPSFTRGTNFGAIGIGTVVSVSIFASIFAVIGLRRWRRRKHNEIVSTRASRQNSNMSDNTVFQFQPAHQEDSTSTNSQRKHTEDVGNSSKSRQPFNEMNENTIFQLQPIHHEASTSTSNYGQNNNEELPQLPEVLQTTYL